MSSPSVIDRGINQCSQAIRRLLGKLNISIRRLLGKLNISIRRLLLLGKLNIYVHIPSHETQDPKFFRHKFTLKVARFNSFKSLRVVQTSVIG